MRRQWLIGCGAVCALCCLPLAAGANPRGTAIRDQIRAAMYGLKSYEATWTMTITRDGKKYGNTMRIKAVPKTGKVRMDTNTLSADGERSTSQVVDDGTYQYFYRSNENSYNRQPHQVGLPENPMTWVLGTMKGIRFDYLRDETVDGRPRRVLTTPIAGQRRLANYTSLIFIDQKTRRFYRSSNISRGANGRGGSRTVVQVSNEIINAPLPAATFRFTPPAGSREIAR